MIDHSEKHRSPIRNTPQPLAFRGTDAKEFPILLMMHVQELETIKRHRLNILIVVMNDGAYGSELHKLRSEEARGRVGIRLLRFRGHRPRIWAPGKDGQESGRPAEVRGGVRRKRRRRGLGLSRLG
jgi:hypothetical protein